MAFTPIEQTKSSGFTPIESSGGFTPIEEPKSDASAGKVFAKSAVSSAAESVVAAPGMAAGAWAGGELGMLGGPAAPVTVPLGAIAGGFIGYMLSSKLVEAGADTIPENVKAIVGYDKETRQAERKAHPDAAFRGDLTGGLVLFRPGSGLKAIEYAKDKFISPLTQRAGMAAVSGGINAGQQAVSDEPMNWEHVAEATVWGGVAATPTKYMDKLGGIFHTRTPVMTPDMAEWLGRNKEWKPNDTTADGVPIVVGNTGKTRADGTYVPAVHLRNEDGSSKAIHIDLEHLKSTFDEKQWTKPKLEGVKPLSENEFKTEDEWAQFVLAHEEAHTRVSRPKHVSKADHENLINELALEHIRQKPEYNLPDVDGVAVPKDKDLRSSWLSNGLYSLGKGMEADKALGMQFEKQAVEEHGYTPEDAVAIRKSFETNDTSKLDPRQMEIRSKYYEQAHAEIKRLVDYGIKEGIMDSVHLNEAETGFHFSSKLVPKKLNFKEKFMKAAKGGDQGGYDLNVAGKKGAGTERNVFVAESPNGRRIVIQKIGNSAVRWENGKQYKFMDNVPELRAGETVQNYKIKNHTVEEVEQHTPYTYEKDSMGVLFQRLAELRSTIRAHDYIKDITNSEWFKEGAHKIEAGKEMPEGYSRPKHLDKLPQFEGYAFPKRTTEIIEDFAKNYNENLLTFFSGALIKNMMLNPLPHILNEGWHLYNARGLTGWVTPAGITRLAKTGVPALKQVLGMTPEYMETLRLGGSLLSANTRSNAFSEGMFRRANQEFNKTPEAASLAKKLGISLMDLYDRVSQQSNVAMWTIRDMMYMQQVNEHMKYDGMDRAAAIKETERHMPSYRLESRVGEGILGESLSRSLSETLQNPNVTVFSRYHYGLVKSLLETGKDIAGIRKGREGVKNFAHGLDTLAAIAVAMSALYPLQDLIAQKLTGNDDAKVRRAGPFHIFNAISGLMDNEKDPYAVLASIFTFNPAFLAAAQFIADRKLYNGQPVFHPEDDPLKIAYDIGKYAITQLPWASQVDRAMKAEDEGFKQWVARQFDVESPTEEQVQKQVRQQNKTTKAGARRSDRWRSEL